MRLHRLLGGRRLSWIRRRCHRQLRRPEFPRPDHRGVGGVTPPLAVLAAREELCSSADKRRSQDTQLWHISCGTKRTLRDVCHLSALPFHHGDSKGRPCRQCDGRSERTNDLTSSIVPRGTSFHRWVELDLLLLHLILHRSQAAATSLVHRNSVPSTHMRCIITAKRRASATIAFFSPRWRAIFIAQALSQDHFAERISRIWAAS